MVIQGDVVLDELLDHGVVIFRHLTFLCIIGFDQFIGLLGREFVVGGSKDRKYLTTVQGLVVTTGLYHLGEVAQVAVLRNSLPECLVIHPFAFVVEVIIPCVGAGREGEDCQCKSYHLIIYMFSAHNFSLFIIHLSLS